MRSGGMPMAANARRACLVLSETDKSTLERISASRSEPVGRVNRSKILLVFHAGGSIRSIAKLQGVERTTVQYTIDKALDLGPLVALDDLPRPGRPNEITEEAVDWLISLACQKPVAL